MLGMADLGPNLRLAVGLAVAVGVAEEHERFVARAEQIVAEEQHAVRRDDGGQGGSLWMHTQVKAGSRMVTSAPIQGFPLDASADDAVLIAGGIGVTPIVSMAAALSAAGRHYSVHYSARNPDQLAFVDELEVLAGPNLKLYADEGSLPPLNLDALLAGMAPTQRIYVCGPAGMIDAARWRKARAKAGCTQATIPKPVHTYGEHSTIKTWTRGI